MQRFIPLLLTCSVTMSMLALLYLALTPLLAKRYSATGRYYAWLVLVLGLIVPFRPRLGWALVSRAWPGVPGAVTAQLGNGAQLAVAVANRVSPSPAGPSWQWLAAGIWLAGMVVFLAYSLCKHSRFSRLTARWSTRVTDQRTWDLLQSLKSRLGIAQSIDLWICDSIDSPMLLGFVNPRILLPRASLTQEALCFVLQHELVHYKRRDLWYKGLVLTATAIHWFNPVVHLMARAINLQCELSCDAEVVRGGDPETRRSYGETVLNAARRRPTRGTALSTNFYGGKKEMKKRIGSILDGRKRRAGVAVLVCALLLTLGTGLALAADGPTQDPADGPTQDPAERVPYAYSFRPDPELYASYAPYGITLTEDGQGLLYQGQRVRLFVDQLSATETFFLDESGTLDLQTTGNASSGPSGVELIPAGKAQAYRSAFFADDVNPNLEVKETVHEDVTELTGQNKLAQYADYGVTPSADGQGLDYHGQRVRLLVDALSDGNFETFWTDQAGTVALAAVRTEAGQITSITDLSEEQARKYLSAWEEQEQGALQSLEQKTEAKTEAKIKALLPEAE